MSLLSDLRIAARTLRRTPGLTLPAVLVLALGIGATTAVFSVVDHVLFRPLRVAGADRLVTVCETRPDAGDHCTVSTPNLMDWASRSRSFAALGAARGWVYSLRTRDGASPLNVGIATPGFLRALGVAPAAGRLLAEGDMLPRGDARVAVVGHAFWRDRMGADPAAVGRTLRLDEEAYTVVGVLPADAVIPRVERAEVWLPLPWDPADEENRGWRGFVAAGRLAPGVSAAEAGAELRALNAALALEHPEAFEGWSLQVVGMQDRIVGGVRPVLLLFLAAVLLVLLLACVNVAALLLARATTREREVAVRYALGAAPGRMVRQLLAESAVLALAGGAAGALVAVWAVEGFLLLAPEGIPRLDEAGVDGRVLAFALAITLLCGLLSAAVPVLRVREMEIGHLFRAGRAASPGRGAGRVRRAMVAAELALALVLVTGAGLLLRSFAGLLEWSPGFDTERVLTFQLFPSQGRYAEREQVLDLYRRVEEELGALPGVASVSTASAGPLFGGGDGETKVVVEGRADAAESAPSALWYDVGPAYFATLGVPLLRGRGFTEADDADAPPVALVNRAMAERLWPGADPVGSRLSLPELETSVEVVGVVGDVAPFFDGTPPAPELYLSNRQRTRWATYFVLRASVDPATLPGPAARAVERLDPELEPSRMATIEQNAGEELARPRFNLLLVGLFAMVALVLGVVGVYGVIAYSVETRTREIGIRMALGAAPARVVGWVLRGAAGVVLAGTAAGIAGALAFSRLLEGLLYGVAATDPAAFAGAAALLGGSALLAALRPAVRAARTDPMLSLRAD